MDQFQIHIMEEHIAAGLPDGEQLEKFTHYLCPEGLAVSMLTVTHTMKTLYIRLKVLEENTNRSDSLRHAATLVLNQETQNVR